MSLTRSLFFGLPAAAVLAGAALSLGESARLADAAEPFGPPVSVPAETAPDPSPEPEAPAAPVIPGEGPAVSVPREPGAPAATPGKSQPPTGPRGQGPAVAVPNRAPGTGPLPPPNPIDQTQAQADAKSTGCLQCHQGIEEMHNSPHVVLGCTDCHGGDPVGFDPGLVREPAGKAYRQAKLRAHVQPKHPEIFKTSANPVDSNVALNQESPAFIKFMNPGDLRIADETCGLCHNQPHAPHVSNVRNSMMTHSAMLWGAAAYNNGSLPYKNYRFGEAYSRDGQPLKLINPSPVTPGITQEWGILPYLLPLPRFNLSHPGNILRIFEKGGQRPAELGLPIPNEPPGRPERRLSDRGLGTLNRIDPVVLNAQKTRLNDPFLYSLGTNDHPGDYRSSGCTACHVIYANDRSPTNSGWWSKFGNQGLSFSGDPTIPKNESGHPIKHQFTRSVPSSQCMVCHMHQGNLFVNPYLGYTWWDQQSDGEFMYPKEQDDPTDEELAKLLSKNPEEAAARGLWKDLSFLEKVSELNPKLKHTQFADYHGHGWVFRAVFKKDRAGNLVDLKDNKIDPDDPHKWEKAIHLNDVHLKRGMQCVDCHFLTDVHGNGNLYGEPRNATSIECIDCHGTAKARPTLRTTGNAAQVDLASGTTPWGQRFFWKGEKLYQRSNMDPKLIWEVPQTIDTITPGNPHYNAKSAYAKTLQRDGETWGAIPDSQRDCMRKLAHDDSAISCQVCHTSWATSCFGCHLPMKANMLKPLNKFEGTNSRNYTPYNPQVIRDDVFMLGVDGTVKSNRHNDRLGLTGAFRKEKMAVLRSSSAVVVGSQNASREWFYSQQQTVSAEGYSGQAFNPHFAHTTSGVGTTKNCTDCHLSKANDNNAIMTQLLGYGTGTVNFFGRYAYMGEGDHGWSAVIWTEITEPQAAFGSNLHQLAYPANFGRHVENDRVISQKSNGQNLPIAFHHHAKDIQDLVLRGEYLFTANGPGGFEVFDVANIDQKGFSERAVTGPFSPLGHKTYVRSPFATSVALPSTMINDAKRKMMPENEEQPIHPMHNYAFVTDREEGLLVVDVSTLVNGAPDDNFLKKNAVFNPGGILNGATFAVVAGENLYVCVPSGVVVVNIDDPLHPRVTGELRDGWLKNPRCISVQVRYAFVTDDDGLKVLDITAPTRPAPVPTGVVPLADPHRLYVARTYAYVANGREGLAIIDITNPEKPRLDQMYNADGQLNDTRAIQIGAINVSMFGLVADGHNGLRVLELIAPDTVPGYLGFSPRPNPRLVATYKRRFLETEATVVSRGLDRDRVVDESGNQAVVFGRRGSRPFRTEEMRAFFRHYRDLYPDDPSELRNGALYKVEDVATGRDGQVTTSSGKTLLPASAP